MPTARRPLPPAFEFVRPLGAGAVGEVILARQRSLDRLVAIKRIHAFTLSDADALERFRREAVVLARLHSPVIVAVYDFTVDEYGAMIVMEYVDGAPLDQHLASGPLPAVEAIRILSDVSEALDTAGAAGIVHRDVKPANVIVARSGRAELGDFGLARVVTDPVVFRTAGVTVAGTPAYLAPEIANGSEPDRCSDAYSLAVMAFEMLTGCRPYVADDAMTMVAAHHERPVPRADQVRPGFPTAAADALELAMAKDPARRLSATDLIGALRAVPPDRWPPSSSVTETAQPPPTAPPSVIAPSASRPRRRGRRRWMLALAAVVVAGTALAVVLANQSTPSLRVRAVTVTADPARGHCPRQRFELVGTVDTNGGAGRLTLAWHLPSGHAPARRTVAVRAGQRSVSVGVQLTVTGTRALTGAARLTATCSGQPRIASSARFEYRCR